MRNSYTMLDLTEETLNQRRYFIHKPISHAAEGDLQAAIKQKASAIYCTGFLLYSGHVK